MSNSVKKVKVRIRHERNLFIVRTDTSVIEGGNFLGRQYRRGEDEPAAPAAHHAVMDMIRKSACGIRRTGDVRRVKRRREKLPDVLLFAAECA